MPRTSLARSDNKKPTPRLVGFVRQTTYGLQENFDEERARAREREAVVGD